jgi:hypothetical protein
MPVKLSTKFNKIESLSNTLNSKLISELCEYMKKNSLSESHIKNTLKTNMPFSEFLAARASFYEVNNLQYRVQL